MEAKFQEARWRMKIVSPFVLVAALGCGVKSDTVKVTAPPPISKAIHAECGKEETRCSKYPESCECVEGVKHSPPVAIKYSHSSNTGSIVQYSSGKNSANIANVDGDITIDDGNISVSGDNQSVIVGEGNSITVNSGGGDVKCFEADGNNVCLGPYNTANINGKIYKGSKVK